MMEGVIGKLNSGQIISCTDNQGLVTEGELLTFDVSFRLILIKSPSTLGKPATWNVKIINLNFVRDLKILRENESPQNPLPNLNLKKLSTRARVNGEAKMKKVDYIGINVSPIGQKLLDSITKIIQDVSWQEDRIIVMSEVKISPPYFSEDCSGPDGSHALNLVKNLVDKFNLNNKRSKAEDSLT